LGLRTAPTHHHCTPHHTTTTAPTLPGPTWGLPTNRSGETPQEVYLDQELEQVTSPRQTLHGIWMGSHHYPSPTHYWVTWIPTIHTTFCHLGSAWVSASFLGSLHSHTTGSAHTAQTATSLPCTAAHHHTTASYHSDHPCTATPLTYCTLTHLDSASCCSYHTTTTPAPGFTSPSPPAFLSCLHLHLLTGFSLTTSGLHCHTHTPALHTHLTATLTALPPHTSTATYHLHSFPGPGHCTHCTTLPYSLRLFTHTCYFFFLHTAPALHLTPTPHTPPLTCTPLHHFLPAHTAFTTPHTTQSHHSSWVPPTTTLPQADPSPRASGSQAGSQPRSHHGRSLTIPIPHFTYSQVTPPHLPSPPMHHSACTYHPHLLHLPLPAFLTTLHLHCTAPHPTTALDFVHGPPNPPPPQ